MAVSGVSAISTHAIACSPSCACAAFECIEFVGGEACHWAEFTNEQEVQSGLKPRQRLLMFIVVLLPKVADVPGSVLVSTHNPSTTLPAIPIASYSTYILNVRAIHRKSAAGDLLCSHRSQRVSPSCDTARASASWPVNGRLTYG